MDKKNWIASIIAFILGFFVAWLIFRSPIPATAPESLAKNEGKEAATSSEETKKIEEKNPVVSTGINGEGTITIEDQEFGDSVSISSVTLGAAGWIAIHEDRDGGLGNILGAGWFPAGTSEGAEIELLRATVPGAAYYAVLRSDDGDREFDRVKDAQFEDEDGKVLQATFRTLPLVVE